MKKIIDGNLINYKKVGTGPINIVFLHGWRSSLDSWEVVQKELSNRQYTAYYIDLPGFGGSSNPIEDFSVSDYARTIQLFLEGENIKKVYLIGHSVGGRISISFASEYPNIVIGLVLVNSAGFVDMSLRSNALKLGSRFIGPFFRIPFMKRTRKKTYKLIKAEDYLEREDLKGTYLKIINEDLTICMSKIKAPTLIIWGDKDEVTPISFGYRMNELISGSTLKILKNAGHYSFLDSSEEFLKILREFIN